MAVVTSLKMRGEKEQQQSCCFARFCSVVELKLKGVVRKKGEGGENGSSRWLFGFLAVRRKRG